MKPTLVLLCGPNGAGKTTVARALATKYRGLHIQIDMFSSMSRGKFWYTRKNNQDKIALVLGTLDAAMQKTKYRFFFVDGVLIFRFMFVALEQWCNRWGIRFIPIFLTGNFEDLNFRVETRKALRKDVNEELPAFYETFDFKKAHRVVSTGKKPKAVISQITKHLTRG